MRTKKLLLNSIFAAFSQAIVLITGMILPQIFISVYGSEINGMVSSILQFISYITLIESGLGVAAVYALYKPLVEKDYKGINEIIYSAKIYYFKTATIFSILIIILSIFYPFFIHSEALPYSEILLLVLVLGSGGAIEFITMAKYRVLLTADQRIYVLSIAAIIGTLVNFSITYCLYTLNINIILVKFISLVSYFIRSYFLSAYVKKNYPLVSYKKNSKKIIVINNRMNALFLQLSSITSISIPTIAVTVTCTLKQVSVFSVYNMIFSGIMSIITIFTTGMSATFGQIYAENNKSLFNNRYNQFEFVLYNIITVLYACAIILIMPFIAIYTINLTDTQYYFPQLGYLFVIWGVTYCIKIPQNTVISASGKFKETKIINKIQLLLFLTLPFIGGRKIGIDGVLISMILINILHYFYLICFISKNVLPNCARSSLFRLCRMILIIFIFNYLLNDKLSFYIIDFYTWFILATIIFVIITICVFLVAYIFEPKISRYLFEIIVNVFKNSIYRFQKIIKINWDLMKRGE